MTAMTTEIDALRALLSAAPRPQGWSERRMRLDTVATLDPIGSDVTLQGERFGEVPVEWSRTATADPSSVLIYFHGGGYCSGSIASHRGLVTAAGRAASISTLAVGYRLALSIPSPPPWTMPCWPIERCWPRVFLRDAWCWAATAPGPAWRWR
ncbi:acetyl esterase/lipase [Rhodoligotrophos appendicifer]